MRGSATANQSNIAQAQSNIARERFAALLATHLANGIRPNTSSFEPWTYAAFSREVESQRVNEMVSARSVSNWCRGACLPEAIDPIAQALFGRLTNSRHAAARNELLEAFQAARAEKTRNSLARASRDKAGRQWIIGETPAPATAEIPENVEEQARAMILEGHVPPDAWIPHIHRLAFRDTTFNRLDLLSRLSELQTLDLRGTPVSNLAPLANLPGMQILILRETPVGDLAPLIRLSGLQTLDLRDTRVSDLAPVARLSGLQTLGLRDTNVGDLASLAGLSELQRLDLTNTPVGNLAPLARLSWLQTLDLRGTRVSDLVPLARLSGLRILGLRDTPVSELER